MKANGSEITGRGKENSSPRKGTIKGVGSRIRDMGMALLSTKTGTNTPESGSKTRNMEKGPICIQTGIDSREPFTKTRKTDSGGKCTSMKAHTKDSG